MKRSAKCNADKTKCGANDLGSKKVVKNFETHHPSIQRIMTFLYSLTIIKKKESVLGTWWKSSPVSSNIKSSRLEVFC